MSASGWSSVLWRFFFPRLTKWFWLRLAVLVVVAVGFFGGICRPMRLNGASMEPNWHDGGVTFCWRPRFWFRAPQRGEPVMIRFAGERVMLLKRVVAFGGETVAFRGGKLLVNGQELDEPYVKRSCTWDLPPRTVQAGYIYVVGDNRDMPLEAHQFGEVLSTRIVGGPGW